MPNKRLLFYSAQRVPNEVFSEEDLLALIRLQGASEAKGFIYATSKSKADWKQFLTDSEIDMIVLLDVSDFAEYEVPTEEFVPMFVSIGEKLVSSHFGVVQKKGVLIFATMEQAPFE